MRRLYGIAVITVCVILMIGVQRGYSQNLPWKYQSDRLISQYKIETRERKDIPETGIQPSLRSRIVHRLDSIEEYSPARGVKSRYIWGKGFLAVFSTLAPNTEIPRDAISAERFMIVMKGRIDQRIDGRTVPMQAIEYERMTPISGHRERKDIIYLEKGVSVSLKAGETGAEIIEVYSPVPAALLEKAGVKDIPKPSDVKDFALKPSLIPGRVYDLYSLQYASILPEADSRIISGRNIQLSFMTIDPKTLFPRHLHPEEELTVVLRGDMDAIILDEMHQAVPGNIIYYPGGMVHGAATGQKGCDILSVFWPVRPDYTEKINERLAEYHEIIPEDSEPELIVDGAKSGPGLVYCEGPSWIRGKLYFSSMGYDDAWNGDIGNSAFVEMEPDGTYRHLVYGTIETNGTFPLKNGNMAVCDMFGHRVIEMDTKGNIVRTLAVSCEGKRLDGPNDIVADSKGGIYFTDPQILPEPHYQPGRSVIYIRPNGETVRVVPPGVLIKPNGLILSPDGSILYVNSTHENFMMAYDVNGDGTLSNGRKFGKLRLTPEMLDQNSINTQVDGMTVDERGNVYITSMIGLQIFNPDGGLIGIIRFPMMPVNCCFGGSDGKSLYVLCNDRVYRVRMKVRGVAYTMILK